MYCVPVQQMQIVSRVVCLGLLVQGVICTVAATAEAQTASRLRYYTRKYLGDQQDPRMQEAEERRRRADAAHREFVEEQLRRRSGSSFNYPATAPPANFSTRPASVSTLGAVGPISGVWSIDMPGKPGMQLFFSVIPDGSYALHMGNPGGPPLETGRIEVSRDSYTLTALTGAHTGRIDSGTFRFLASNRMYMKGLYGKGTWLKVSNSIQPFLPPTSPTPGNQSAPMSTYRTQSAYSTGGTSVSSPDSNGPAGSIFDAVSGSASNTVSAPLPSGTKAQSGLQYTTPAGSTTGRATGFLPPSLTPSQLPASLTTNRQSASGQIPPALLDPRLVAGGGTLPPGTVARSNAGLPAGTSLNSMNSEVSPFVESGGPAQTQVFSGAGRPAASEKPAQGSSPPNTKPAPKTTDLAKDRPVKDKWALVVGISKFQNAELNLKCAATDARDFGNFLIKDCNFAADHVRVITDEQATRSRILNELGDKWLPRVVRPDDLVVVYISTHGSPSDVDLGGVNYLITWDTDPESLYASGLPMQDLMRLIKGRLRSDRVMIVLDACYSGNVNPQGKGLHRGGNMNVDEIVQGTGQLVISSSEANQMSWESKTGSNSVFTKHLMSALRINGDKTKLGEAFRALREHVEDEVQRERGKVQIPVLRSQWEGSELMLSVPASDPRPGL